MERIVTVVGPTGAAADVRLPGGGDASVSDVLFDLQRVATAPGTLPHRARRALDLRTPLSDLADGDVITLETARPTVPPAGTEVVVDVVSGPDAGQLLTLPEGRHCLGRDGILSGRDAMVSRRHADVLVSPAGALSVIDLESRNGTYLGDSELPAGTAVTWPAGVELRVGSTRLRHSRVSFPAAIVPTARGELLVNPPPRLLDPAAPAVIRFPADPQLARPGRLPLLASLAPLVAGLVLAFVLRRWEFAAFALMSPLVVLGQAASDRWATRRTNKTAVAAHAEAVAAAEADLRAALAAENTARHHNAPDLALLVRAATEHTDLLWQRRTTDPDALTVRLGLGELTPETTVDGAAPPPPMSDVPVCLDLRRAPVVGLHADADTALGLARALVVQLATLHGPGTLRLVVLAPGRAQRWAWVRWLPHVRTATAKARVAFTPAQVRARLDELAAQPSSGHTVVVVDGVDDGALADALTARPQTSVLWVSAGDAPVPAACSAVLEPARGSTSMCLRRTGAPDVDVAPELVQVEVAESVARALAPLRDGSAADRGGLPTSVRWSELYELDLADQPGAAVALERRWRAGPTTAVCLGMSHDGPLVLDLQYDGPHMLVAGTTGAGKSELLQSLVASLVAGNSPTQLNLLLVDFKGGAAFGPCVSLPHTVGVLTDLDPAATTRALTSLSAELRRRERAFAAAGVVDLDGWRAATAGTEPTPMPMPMPRLVIVVDEFATLSEELPDFVGGLVAIAQRGRSLGIHLVLATQRPEGAVSADIRANTRLRVCLAVARETESRDVIDSAHAASISRSTPGRALVRIGTHELREVQTARVAAPWTAQTTRVAVVPLPAWGEAAAPAEPTDATTELDLLVAAAELAASRIAETGVAAPWLPPLPTSVATHELPAAGHACVAVGVVDMPDEQRQPALELARADPDPLLVVGASRSGRTTAAITIATSLAAALSPDDLHLFAIDSGRGLAPLSELRHTGAVVDARDTDRVERLLGYLSGEVERRRDRANTDDPQLLLVIDTWDGVLAATGDADAGRCQDMLLRLAATGASAQLRLVVTSDRSGLSGRLGATIARKLCLRLADRGDFALLGLPARQVPTHLPVGRALCAPALTWAQLATADQLLVDAARGWPRPARPPRRFDPLPHRVPLHSVAHPSGLVVGVRGDDLAPLVLDPRESGVLLVAGPPGSGRSTALVSMATQLRDRPIVALCPRRGPLRQRRDLALVADPHTAGELDAALAAIADGAALLVDDIDLVDDARALDGIEAAVRQARDGDGFVVLAGATDAMAASFRGPVAQARRARAGLLLHPEGPHDGELLGLRLRRRAVQADPPGRGILALNGTAVAVQVPDPG